MTSAGRVRRGPHQNASPLLNQPAADAAARCCACAMIRPRFAGAMNSWIGVIPQLRPSRRLVSSWFPCNYLNNMTCSGEVGANETD